LVNSEGSFCKNIKSQNFRRFPLCLCWLWRLNCSTVNQQIIYPFGFGDHQIRLLITTLSLFLKTASNFSCQAIFLAGTVGTYVGTFIGTFLGTGYVYRYVGTEM
jgi:hypothetical protein